ncbi:MAG: Trm112 family protein, partial [Elusimicrobiota bacterium]
MRARLLDWLACPLCGSGLAFAPSCAPRGEEDVENGALVCSSCRRDYPIQDSIPRLVPGALDSGNAKTRESFSWEWLRYPGSLPEDKPIFLSETQLPESYWRGRLILDGGCGMGRYTRVALALGAEVVALDLSESLTRLLDRARVDPKLHLVQGDLLR